MSEVVEKAGVLAGGINVGMSAGDRPPGTKPAFVRQVPWAKAMDRRHDRRLGDGRPNHAARSRHAAACDRSRVGRRLSVKWLK